MCIRDRSSTQAPSASGATSPKGPTGSQNAASSSAASLFPAPLTTVPVYRRPPGQVAPGPLNCIGEG
eukprot:14780128-Alexandrium_andersonii.AAC.1